MPVRRTATTASERSLCPYAPHSRLHDDCAEGRRGLAAVGNRDVETCKSGAPDGTPFSRTADGKKGSRFALFEGAARGPTQEVSRKARCEALTGISTGAPRSHEVAGELTVRVARCQQINGPRARLGVEPPSQRQPFASAALLVRRRDRLV